MKIHTASDMIREGEEHDASHVSVIARLVKRSSFAIAIKSLGEI